MIKSYQDSQTLLKDEYSDCHIKRKFARYCKKNHDRGRSFPDFTWQELQKWFRTGECFYCGSKNDLSLDRIDNSKGYFRDNVLIACTHDNTCRSNLYSVNEYKQRYL